MWSIVSHSLQNATKYRKYRSEHLSSSGRNSQNEQDYAKLLGLGVVTLLPSLNANVNGKQTYPSCALSVGVNCLSKPVTIALNLFSKYNNYSGHGAHQGWAK